MIIDTHAHLTYGALWEDLSFVLSAAYANDVKKIVNICLSESDIEKGKILVQTETIKIYLTAAMGPNDNESDFKQYFKSISTLAIKGRLIAIGETGMDRFHNYVPVDVQSQIFIEHLNLARATSLPVIIHCRDAFEDVIRILDDHYLGKSGQSSVIFHCFSGDMNDAKKVIERGMFLGIGGSITYKKNEGLRQAVMGIPKETFVVETDAPFMAPGTSRGKLNSPALIKETVEFIAQIRQEGYTDVCKQTLLNTNRALGI